MQTVRYLNLKKASEKRSIRKDMRNMQIKCMCPVGKKYKSL